MPVNFEGNTIVEGNVLVNPEEVFLPPVANFIVSPNVGQEPLTAQFTFTGSGEITEYKWDFESTGSAQSTLQNPTFEFASVGQYTISLTVSGPGGSDTETKINFVEVVSAPPPPPIADFTAASTSGQSPFTTTFTYTGTGPVTEYKWDFESTGSAQSTLQNPEFTFISAGQHTVSVTVSGSSGSDTETKINYINVTPPPPPPPQPFQTSFLLGGTATGNTGSGDFNWPNPSNVLVDSTSETSVSFTEGGDIFVTYDSRRLLVTNFNFNIPSTATITGLEAQINRRGQASFGGSGGVSVTDREVRLWNGSASIGSNQKKSGGGGNWISKNFNVVTYGASNFTWGTTLTPAIVNASGFGIFFRVRIQLSQQVRDNDANPTVSGTARVRWIKMRIFYLN